MAACIHRCLTRGLAVSACLTGLFAASVALAETTYSILDFKELNGWANDDHAAALAVFNETCADINDADWRPICAAARQQKGGARSFFELFFRPVLIEDGDAAMFTGYFEPELNGSRRREGAFIHPVYRYPPEAANKPWLTRRQIIAGRALAGRGLEIAWVDDPVELFFLQIQGSGRIRLQNGDVIRVGYAGANGHPYRSIGQEMVRRGIYKPHQVSAQVIRNWVRRNPFDGRELLFHNPSYVFFRVVNRVPPEKGPLGAMNRSVTPGRTVAIDPAFYPLGAPVWIEKEGETRMRRLMVAQDTGSAIKGAQRADIFFGTGAKAGRAAGRLRDPGRLVVLLPIQRAFALVPDGGI